MIAAAKVPLGSVDFGFLIDTTKLRNYRFVVADEHGSCERIQADRIRNETDEH
jgi:hypothetical protein